MLVNERIRGFVKLFEKIGVRYQVPKKIWISGCLGCIFALAKSGFTSA